MLRGPHKARSEAQAEGTKLLPRLFLVSARRPVGTRLECENREDECADQQREAQRDNGEGKSGHARATPGLPFRFKPKPISIRRVRNSFRLLKAARPRNQPTSTGLVLTVAPEALNDWRR